MDIEKIMEELNRRFAEPLPEFYKRRIIVWRDEDREFEDRLSEISLSNAKTAALTETNFFATKKLLCADDTTGNYLLYCPITFESQEDNWLLDIELYSEEFRADMISMWMDEMGVPSTPWLRKSFKTYRKFFNVKERRRAAAALHGSLENPRQLEAAVMAVLAGVSEARAGAVIRAVLKGGLSMEENPIYRSFVSYGVDGAFWLMLEKGTGYCEETGDLGRFAIHMLLTAATRRCGRSSLPVWRIGFPPPTRLIAMISSRTGCMRTLGRCARSRSSWRRRLACQGAL